MDTTLTPPLGYILFQFPKTYSEIHLEWESEFQLPVCTIIVLNWEEKHKVIDGSSQSHTPNSMKSQIIPPAPKNANNNNK